MSDWYLSQLARQDQYGDTPPAYWPVRDDALEARDAREAFAARTRRSVIPEGGRDEAPGQILGPLTEHLVLNPLRKGQRLLQTNIDADAEMRPVQSGITSVSTDYDPRRASADMAAGTGFNVMLGSFGMAPRGSLGSSGGRLGIGGNNPPPEFAMKPEDMVGGLAEVAAKPKTWAQSLPRPQPAKRSTDIPDIRELPVDQAVDVARTQPHLIKAGDQSEGFYVGGPRDISSKRALNAQRKYFDEYIAADPRGGDWYDRYRRAVDEVTGGNPQQSRWMTNQEGQWSAGVDPGSELHFALKENNASIAGMPVKAARPAQHEAHLEAIRTKDPYAYQLGDKTGEYAELTNPDVARATPPGATGVNDFRHARNWGYTEKDGGAQKGALTDAQHKFLDMETALAVDRANKTKLGGRSDWTGEQLQAAPWVRQKALDIMSRNKALTYDEAFARANKQIGDFYPRQTYNATHEAQPGAETGHMIGSIAAGANERAAYAMDPRSTWATAPNGRDAIYSGLGIPGTGVNMRVRPTVEMSGMFEGPRGLETNKGWVARPMGTFSTGGKDEPFKTATPADRMILNAGETLRAGLDAQQGGAWHKIWRGGPVNESNSLLFNRPGPSSVANMKALQATGRPLGLPDVTDTGAGMLGTRFGEPPAGGKDFNAAIKRGDFDQYGDPIRVRVDANYLGLDEAWKQGVGSTAVTQKILDAVTQTPELRAAFNANPYLPEQAAAKMARDKDWAETWGAPREDLQNLRRIIAESKGDWIDRVVDAMKKGVILPATAAAFFAAAGSAQREGNRAGS